MKELYPRKIDLSKEYLYKRYCSNFPQLKNYLPKEFEFTLFKNNPVSNNNIVIEGDDGSYLMLEKLKSNCFPREMDEFAVKILNDSGIKSESFGIMGILNVTPDSFSDGGNYDTIEKALKHAEKLISDGADIIDVGGESSRPGAPSVEVDEEMRRVLPVIKEIKNSFPKSIISIDTTKSLVAEKAVEIGADIVNDISCFDSDYWILDVCSRNDIPLIGMHMNGNPQTMQNNPFYTDVVEEVLAYFQRKIDQIEKRNFHKFILDPGIGFGKRVKDNFEIIDRCSEFKLFGYPVLIGLSKKSYIGKSLNLEVDERENATIISELLAIKNGVDFVRTHNVRNLFQARQLLKFYKTPEMTDNV
ncbi:MAG: dihydropteroate synthase [Melioribacteraceae bacterium]|nr:MAG: dihydropteroate synthase [Melioribacteraceae bacterium]